MVGSLTLGHTCTVIVNSTRRVSQNLINIHKLLYVVPKSASSADEHECVRECKWPPEPKTCRYVFTVEWLQSMSAACFDCPFNKTDCDRPGCIPVNGVQRPIITINRQLPGPPIQVCEDDDIEVKVWNRLGNSEGTSIHWHGLHQRGTPYMDGAAMITQCPISPQSSFTYKFKASPAGTHWWHSHSNLQRQDGAFGAFVVKQAPEQNVHSDLYDYDLPEHVVFVQDWLHEPTISNFAALPINALGSDTLVINGKGVFREFANGNDTAYTPREVFPVKQGGRYRFRVIGNNICHMIITIQSHNLIAIATDGAPFEPVEVSRIGVDSGARFDFILTADQDIGHYWFRLYTDDLGCPFTVKEEFAILRYEGAPEGDPTESFSGVIPDGRYLNPQPVYEVEDSPSQLPVRKLKSAVPEDKKLQEEPDRRFYLSTSVNFISKWNMYDAKDYPNPALSEYIRDTRQINQVSFKIPSSPLLTQLADVPKKDFCDAEERWETALIGDRCSEEFCNCIQTIKVDVGQVVEIVMVGVEDFFGVDHPLHIHGYSFRVIGGGRLPKGTTIQDIMLLDQQGNLTRNGSDSVIKDTVIVPGDGYVIVKFVADNPGWWLLHCHFIYHVADGMAVVIQVGEPSDLPPIPDNFPRCGSWSPCDDEGDDSEKGRKNGASPPRPRKKSRKHGRE
ncbi:uncharacterized protein [Amphiura filiformis]|uniref:uncharacterized protein n=1 Tax=Amphiura filiformis TaxID=82378 RepID=UPI003B224A16